MQQLTVMLLMDSQSRILDIHSYIQVGDFAYVRWILIDRCGDFHEKFDEVYSLVFECEEILSL